MPDSNRQLSVAPDVNGIEAPVTWKAYLACAFASFGGIFFGYDSGYINGVIASDVFVRLVENLPESAENPTLQGSNQSLIVSILSAGTFFGAIMAGDLADLIGRRLTIVLGCGIYVVGKSLQSLGKLSDAI